MTEGPKKKIAADGHEYHVSSSANATTAPTNEATKANADKSAGLSKAETELVTIIDYEWHLDGTKAPEAIKEDYGYEDDEWTELLSRTNVHQALTERGINLKTFAPDAKVVQEAGRAKLTPIQLVCANAVLDLVDSRPIKKKLQDMNITPYQYQSWLKDPEFSNYLRERAENLLGDVQHEAMLSLVDKVMSGDMNAIKYYHEITGRYVQVSARESGNGSTHDLQQMVVRIIEIIVDECDSETAAKIADRLKGLVMGHQIVNAVTETPVVPEIAQARELTPAVQALMSKGVGVNT